MFLRHRDEKVLEAIVQLREHIDAGFHAQQQELNDLKFKLLIPILTKLIDIEKSLSGRVEGDFTATIQTKETP
jgi:hypothetical protein